LAKSGQKRWQKGGKEGGKKGGKKVWLEKTSFGRNLGHITSETSMF